MAEVTLPTADGSTENYMLGDPKAFEVASPNTMPRIAYSAAHVVANPLHDGNPSLDTAIDWDATIEYRRYLYSLGLGVAEAMDTAQRGMGVDWPNSLELIKRSIDAAQDFEKNNGVALLASGGGTDQLEPGPDVTIDNVIAAYEEQCEAIEGAGGRIVLMASRALAAAATSPEDYLKVYDRILSQVKEPVIIHWLGEMFDPALAGYWGSEDHWAAMDTCLEMLTHNAAKVDGVKVSLLDAEKEIVMRNKLPEGVCMYTGDDFNFPELIAGDDDGYSDALLGIFDAIAPAASAALAAMGKQDMAGYHDLLEPTLPLSRHIFKAPTRFYKTGVVFLAYLNGHQDHFLVVGGQEGTRSTLHLAELFRLADKAGLLRNPDLAAERMENVMTIHGVAA
jgi:hypothetical protein|tara:strand:- start:11587 stop:12765 length:1179 start_codon:yes stop_codon:yes gene_type:complete